MTDREKILAEVKERIKIFSYQEKTFHSQLTDGERGVVSGGLTQLTMLMHYITNMEQDDDK